jgi:predicted MPP superfamily phosphohydrolase
VDRRTFLKRTTLLGMLTAAAMATEGYAVERDNFEVTRFPAGEAGAGLKIAYMSDFHRSRTTSHADLVAAAELCNAQAPDIVLLGGDFISDDTRLAPDCADALAHLRARHGIFYVLGNHDHWHGAAAVRRAMDARGFVELTNRNTRLAPGLSLVALDDVWTGKPDVGQAFAGAARHRIVLSHNPRIFPLIRERDCVVISGHTHGGQINIPLVPNPYLSTWKTYVKGWFHERNSSLYVNRGIGTLTLPIRFRCRPEITILEV